MRNTNKKGFTIVELVIVIAVIAILSAVLIPTFSGIINKANTANDTVVAKNMNTALAEYSALNGKPENFDEVLIAIEEAGYVLANLNAKANGNLYGWDKANNQIVYIDAKGEVIYQNVDFVAADLQIVIANGDVTVPEGFGSAIKMNEPTTAKTLQAALESGVSVALTTDIELVSTVIDIKEDVVIELNGHNLDASKHGSRPFTIKDDATITIKASGTEEINCGKYGLVDIKAGGSVVLEGGNYKANTDNGSFIKIRSSGETVNVTLNNVNYVDESDDGFVVNKSGFYGEFNLTVNGGSYTAFAGFQVEDGVFDGVTVNTKSAAFEISGDVELNNCTITAGNAVVGTAPGACVAVAYDGVATLTNCTLDGAGTGLYIYSTGGSITATGCTIKNNTQKAGEEYGTITIN